jgi:hypothetical protein
LPFEVCLWPIGAPPLCADLHKFRSMQRISKTFLAGRRAVQALCSVPQSTRKTEGGAHKKGRLRCHKQPKSREETPKEGSDSGATAYPYLRRSRSAAQLNGGEGRASKGVTERYEGLLRSPLKPTTSALGIGRPWPAQTSASTSTTTQPCQRHHHGHRPVTMSASGGRSEVMGRPST